MARNLPVGLREVLKSGYAGNHSTLELSLPSDIAPAINHYFATARLTIDGVVYDRQLRNADAVKTSLTRAADRVTVELQNVDTILGVDLLAVADTLYGANVRFGRYWKDLNSKATFHHILLTGAVAGVEVNENVARLTLISDTYAAVSVGAKEQVVRTCRFQVQGEFRGTKCGYSGAKLTCDGLIDSADGCEGRHGTPLKRAKFGGFVYIEGANTIAGASALPIPASNQLIKLVDLTANTETAKLQQPFLALDNDRFHAANNSADLRTEITPKGLVTGFENAVDDYDAPFDGIADATTEVQAAITAAEATGGGAIYLNPGTYKVSGLTMSGRTRLIGSSDGSTVITSTSNAPILDITAGSFEMPAIENIRIRGSVTAGSSQHGIRIDDGTGTGGLRTLLRNVWIEDCGGAGLKIERTFSAIFEMVYASNCAGYPFDMDSANMPSNLFVSCYAGLLRDSAPAGFRIRAGEAVLKSCNGVNSLNPNSKWAIVGKKNGVDGDSTNSGAILDIQDCNLESWIDTGILAYHASLVNIRGNTTFVGQALSNQLNGAINNSVTTITVDSTQYFSTAGTVAIDSEHITYTGKTATTLTGCTRGAHGTSAASHSDNATVTFLKKPIEIEHINEGTDYFAHTLQRGIIEDSVVFKDGPLTAYVRGQAIHANGLATFQTVGRGARIVGGDPLQSYWDSAVGVATKLSRADSYLSKQVVTGTTSFTRPGIHYIEVNHSSAATITLPWPALYTVGDLIIVKDISSAGAATNNISLQANGGGTVNGSSFTMNLNSQAVILAPDGSNDWRIVATYSPGGSGITGSGSANRLAVWNGASSQTSVSGLEYDAGSSVLKSPARFWGADTSASVPTFGFTSDSGTGFYLSSAGVLGFASSAANGGAGGNVVLIGGDTVTLDGRLTLTEKTAPGTPSANSLTIYAKDKAGTSALYFKNDAGTETEISGGSGANTALSNLASVAINTTLVSDANNTDDLGTSSIAWRDLYLAGTFNLLGRSDPGSPTNNDLWRSTTRQQLSIRNSGQTENLSASMWKSSASVFFDTTTTETSIISDTGVGTKTLAANRLVAGSQIRIKASGLYGTKASSPGTFTIKVKNGATTMLTIAAFTVPTNVADQNWWIEATGALSATGASGTIYWSVNFYYNDGTGDMKTRTYSADSIVINTTTTNALDITGQFSVSDSNNYWQTDTAIIEIM